jgi:hypothetical protein
MKPLASYDYVDAASRSSTHQILHETIWLSRKVVILLSASVAAIGTFAVLAFAGGGVGFLAALSTASKVRIIFGAIIGVLIALWLLLQRGRRIEVASEPTPHMIFVRRRHILPAAALPIVPAAISKTSIALISALALGLLGCAGYRSGLFSSLTPPSFMRNISANATLTEQGTCPQIPTTTLEAPSMCWANETFCTTPKPTHPTPEVLAPQCWPMCWTNETVSTTPVPTPPTPEVLAPQCWPMCLTNETVSATPVPTPPTPKVLAPQCWPMCWTNETDPATLTTADTCPAPTSSNPAAPPVGQAHEATKREVAPPTCDINEKNKAKEPCLNAPWWVRCNYMGTPPFKLSPDKQTPGNFWDCLHGYPSIILSYINGSWVPHNNKNNYKPCG